MTPRTAHFIWLGARLPWIYSLALRSAARHGGLERLILHTSHDLRGESFWPKLATLPGFEARRLQAEPLLEAARGAALVELYRKLDDARAQANVLRVALLANEGGVYLDCDTLTVRSLAPLCDGEAFCGLERLVFPAALRWRERPFAFAGALLRTAARDAMRRLPGGFRVFRKLERWYPQAVNNAVLGAPAHHPFFEYVLELMLQVPDARRGVRYELGTTLLQNAVATYRGPGLRVHAPEVFYPLGPEISEHWFRRNPPESLGDVLHPTTRVVHWYASVRTRRVVAEADPAWLRRHAERQLFSSLAVELLSPAET